MTDKPCELCTKLNCAFRNYKRCKYYEEVKNESKYKK